MSRTSTNIRVMALGVAAVIVATLFSTIVSNMPPDFSGVPNEARNGVRDRAAVEVAIVPSRIEVVGVRSAVTASSESPRVEGAPSS